MIAKVDEEHRLTPAIVVEVVCLCFRLTWHFLCLDLYIGQEQAQPARPFGAGPPPCLPRLVNYDVMNL
jgi:hypothetical protein